MLHADSLSGVLFANLAHRSDTTMGDVTESRTMTKLDGKLTDGPFFGL